METCRRELSILAAEDDEATRDFLQIVINSKFPEIPLYLAENGNKGLELFKVHSPGIVITDIVMPEMDGVEMATTIKMLKSDIKLIVVTGHSSTSYNEIFEKIGVSAFLEKPIDLKKLCSEIERCLDEIAIACQGGEQ